MQATRFFLYFFILYFKPVYYLSFTMVYLVRRWFLFSPCLVHLCQIALVACTYQGCLASLTTGFCGLIRICNFIIFFSLIYFITVYFFLYVIPLYNLMCRKPFSCKLDYSLQQIQRYGQFYWLGSLLLTLFASVDLNPFSCLFSCPLLFILLLDCVKLCLY